MALVDILIPTYGRKTGLAVVLTSLFGQTFGLCSAAERPNGDAPRESLWRSRPSAGFGRSSSEARLRAAAILRYAVGRPAGVRR